MKMSKTSAAKAKGGAWGRESDETIRIREEIRRLVKIRNWNDAGLTRSQSDELFDEIRPEKANKTTLWRQHVEHFRYLARLRDAMPEILASAKHAASDGAPEGPMLIFDRLFKAGDDRVRRANGYEFERAYLEYLERDNKKFATEIERARIAAEIRAERTRMIDDASEIYASMPNRQGFTSVKRYAALPSVIQETFGRGELEGIMHDQDSEDVDPEI